MKPNLFKNYQKSPIETLWEWNRKPNTMTSLRSNQTLQIFKLPVLSGSWCALKVYMTDIFLFAWWNLNGILTWISEIIFRFRFPSPRFCRWKTWNFTSGHVKNREKGELGMKQSRVLWDLVRQLLRVFRNLYGNWNLRKQVSRKHHY